MKEKNIPFHLKNLFRSKNGSKDFYKIFTDNETQEPNCKLIRKWKITFMAKDDIWRSIFKGSFKTIVNNYLTWFQYKVLYNDTNDYLFKIKASDSNLCRLCKLYPETIHHLFVQCSQVTNLWSNIIQWI